MISFQAKYLNSAIIKYQTQPNEYKDMNASLVELELNSQNDKRTLKKISKSWEKEFSKLEKQGHQMSGGTCFAKTIYNYYKTSRKESDLKSYYAITLQADNFEKLNPEKVLGIARISNLGFGIYDLEHLQTRPKYTAFIPNSEYRRIGNGFLNSILEILPFRKFQVIQTINSADFYEKCGLKYDPETITSYITK